MQSNTLYWFKHCFASTNVFLNVTDQRYTKGQAAHKPGDNLKFTLAGVNDVITEKTGRVTIKLLNSKGSSVYSETISVSLPASDRIRIPYSLTLPAVAGGYLLVSEFTEKGKKELLISRRYIKVGALEQYDFWDIPIPEKLLVKSMVK